MDALDGRVAVVTGAADGIGRALGESLAAEGMNLVLADIDGPRLHRTAEEIASHTGRDVIALPTDVSDGGSVTALAEAARERFGAVHLLCNNAGVVLPPARLWKVTSNDLAWLLGVNLWGVVHGIKAFVPAMIEQGEPAHVVNTASISGVLGFPRIGAYGASKFAIVGLSESLLLDLREREVPIGVSVLCPGAVATSLDRHSASLRTGEDGPSAPSDDAPRMTAQEVAAQVVAAVCSNRFWILTHSGYGGLLESRTRAMLGGDEELVAPGFFTR